MKKWLSIMLVIVLLLTLLSVTGCKSNVKENTSTSGTETETLTQNDVSSTTSEDTTTSDNENNSEDNTSDTQANIPLSSESTTNKQPETPTQEQKPSQETGTSSGTTSTDKPPTTSQTTQTTKPNTQDKTETDKNSNNTTSSTTQSTPPPDATTSKPPQDTTPVKPSVVTPTAQMISKIKTEFFRLVNEERAKQGRAALTQHSVLNQASDVRAKECFDVFSHTRPNGSLYLSLFDGEFTYNYSAIAENLTLTTNFGDKYITEENIFVGTDEQLNEVAKILFTNFKNSPQHYATMVSADYKEIGIGISTSADTKNNILYISCCNLFGRQ